LLKVWFAYLSAYLGSVKGWPGEVSNAPGHQDRLAGPVVTEQASVSFYPAPACISSLAKKLKKLMVRHCRAVAGGGVRHPADLPSDRPGDRFTNRFPTPLRHWP